MLSDFAQVWIQGQNVLFYEMENDAIVSACRLSRLIRSEGSE